MDVKKTLRCLQTRRFTGRRGLTPIKTKQKKSIPKTRGHKVEKKPYVPLRKHTSSQQSGKRQTTDQEKHSQDQQREGDQVGCCGGERKDEEKHQEVVQCRDTENSTESIHPGPVQTLSALSEQAAVHAPSETPLIEAEELPPW